MNFSPEAREAYEDHLKWLRIEANTIKNYEQIGEARGRAEGKAERSIEIAKAMLSKNHAMADIADLTGLSLEEISTLYIKVVISLEQCNVA
ncbi:MAG: hypothetical protein K2X94_04695 [Amoebophilaceae bacterium]|nr:hypothetical protein [Amoebophilaceae bacterium]